MKKTVKSKVAIEYAFNRQTIQEMLEFNDLQYYEVVFESGMFFLESVFKRDQLIVNKIAFERTFWSWWKIEFSNWEKELLSDLLYHRLILNEECWMMEIDALIKDRITYQGFKNYLKLFHNVRI